MRFLAILLFVACVLAYTSSPNLGQVNDKNFKDEVVDSGKYVFVDFYADWCRHCKQLMPVIEQLADIFEPYNDVLKIVKINGDKDGRKMAKKHAYQGYPTMKLFHGADEPIEYDGGRDVESISNFLQQITKIRLPGGEIKDKEEIIKVSEQLDKSNIAKLNDFSFEKEVLEANHKTVVVFSATWCPNCENLKPTLAELADTIYFNDRDVVRFGKVELDTEPAEKIADRYGINALPSILFFDPAGEKPLWFEGDRNLGALIEQINKYTGLHRTVEGRLLKTAGRVDDLDLLIKEKLLANGVDKTIVGVELLAQLQKFESVSDSSLINYYKKLINKVINGEDHFFQKELDRLSKILANDIDKLQSTTIDSMEKRSNILKVFL
ncbi:protein disulfide isomerase [Suhomyces tanzawaensis NRRL Y-17324]|uniref:protein disulfide-isomerase n=1 Tax=Suhomyces tanzawaensis NRRL Y-17324 TaxID=984487 RepID=A0A1E4SBZ6_9ASCO|nr:protein disulfide isomerase [Suhomyces tanzawaensis NRRL Y-17324]ODV77021.1 protein disulfide isomerase [Suhomyces tanzawaensis NRRL Y-17324]